MNSTLLHCLFEFRLLLKGLVTETLCPCYWFAVFKADANKYRKEQGGVLK